MKGLRDNPITEVAGLKVLEVIDYALGIEDLPKADVVTYKLEDGSQIIIRPSGTEPKLKIYATAVGDRSYCDEVVAKMDNWLHKFIEKC